MRRRKGRAKRRLVKSSEGDGWDVVPAVEVEMKDPEPSKSDVEASKAGNKMEKDTDREIDCFKEEFEEVENVVSAVMEMDVVTQQNQIKECCNIVENISNITESKLNFERNSVNGLEDSEKLDNLDVSLKCSKIEETMEEGNAREKNLGSNIEIHDLDSKNEIENGEEANVHANAEEESVEGEPSTARIKVMKLHVDIDDRYSNKEDDGGENQPESRGDREQNKDFEVSEGNEVAPLFNQDSRAEWKKEKQLELYVGGLHKDAVEQDLFEIFEKFGEVQIARIVRHPTTNKSKGFAFIQYATVEQAKKVLSDLKDGIEVKGKRAKISISRDRDILYLGNICKTWTKEDVLEKLKGLGIEDIDEIQVPTDPKNEGKIKGFAFLRFRTCSDAEAALYRLRKPDATFDNARGAKVAFAHTRIHPREEVRLQVKTIYVRGIPKSWDVKKLRAICEQYGETKKVKIYRNFGKKGKDFGFISFTTRMSAVACVEGMNKVQFGGGIKVKADIARPLVGGHLQKSTCGRLKLNKRRRSTGEWNIKGHAKSEGVEKESDMKAQTIIHKSKTERTEEKAAAVAHKNNQHPSNSKRSIEGETHELESIVPKAHGAGLSGKPEKTDDRRKNRKRQRDRMYRKRLSKKLEGSSQGRPSRSSRISKSQSHLRKGPKRGSNSVAYIIPNKEAYAAPTRGYPVYAYSAVSGSKRLSSDLEPHAGFVQPVKHQDQYHAGCIAPAFRHQRQTYAGYLKIDIECERQPPAKYFKPALQEDALPHAGFLEPAFGKQSFDIDDYPARRTGEYNSPGNQGPVFLAGPSFSHSYVPNSMSYARYEASGGASGYYRVSGAYPPRQTHY